MTERVESLKRFGLLLQDIIEGKADPFYKDSLDRITGIAHEENPFFTSQNIVDALEACAYNLRDEQLMPFLEKDVFPANETVTMLIAEKDILSGVPDWIMAAGKGNKCVFQVPENNKRFLPELVSWFIRESPEYRDKFTFTEGRIDKPAFLLTYPVESDEKQLLKYFRKYRGMTRLKKKAAAVLTGDESQKELEMVVQGIMKFFNQGNHRISKLMVPEGYNFIPLLESFGTYEHFKNHHAYLNNYEYYKSVYLLDRDNFFDNEIILLKESEEMLSPLGVVYFSFYKSSDELKDLLQNSSISGVYSGSDSSGLGFNHAALPAFYRWEDYGINP